jgi:hypothetical protein
LESEFPSAGRAEFARVTTSWHIATCGPSSVCSSGLEKSLAGPAGVARTSTSTETFQRVETSAKPATGEPLRPAEDGDLVDAKVGVPNLQVQGLRPGNRNRRHNVSLSLTEEKLALLRCSPNQNS